MFGEGHQLRHGRQFESTATERLIEFNDKHSTGTVSLTGTLASFFGANLPKDAPFPAQLHFGSAHVSGSASGKGGQTLPFKFSYASMLAVSLKPRSADGGAADALVELRFDLSKVREVVSKDTADNVLRLAVSAKQAEALRQRCLPLLPANVKRSDTIPPSALAAAGSDRDRHPEPSASQRVPGGGGGEAAGATSDPAVAPRGAEEAKKPSAFPSFDQVVRLKNSKEEAASQQGRNVAPSRVSASTVQEASDPSGTRKRAAPKPGAAKPAPRGKPAVAKVAASKPAPKQPAAGAKKPTHGLVQASARGSERAPSKVDTAAALPLSEEADDDDASAASVDEGDRDSSADEDCEGAEQHDSNAQPSRAPAAEGGTRGSVRSAAAAARGAIQRAALADCMPSQEAASTGRDATQEGLPRAFDAAAAGEDGGGGEEAASDEDAGGGMGGLKTFAADLSTRASALASDESSSEDEAPPQGRRISSVAAGAASVSVPRSLPTSKLASATAGPRAGKGNRAAAPRSGLEGEHSSDESSEDEAPLRQRVSTSAKPTVPSKHAGKGAASKLGGAAAVGGAESKSKSADEVAASADVAKRRPNAWSQFLKSKKASLEPQQPGITFPEVQKLASAMWAQMGQAEKDAWADPAACSGRPPAAPAIGGANPPVASRPAPRPRDASKRPLASVSVAGDGRSDDRCSDDEAGSDESVISSPSHGSRGRASSDPRFVLAAESVASADDEHEPIRALQPVARGGSKAKRAATLPSPSSASDADPAGVRLPNALEAAHNRVGTAAQQKDGADGIERGRAVFPWQASSVLGHDAARPQASRRASRAGAVADNTNEIEQLLGRLSEASRTSRRSHIATLSARGNKEIEQHATGTKRKLAAVHKEAPTSAEQLHQKCQRLTTAWESLKAAHDLVCAARLRTSQASVRMLRQLQASRDGQKRRVVDRLQELSSEVVEAQKKVRHSRLSPRLGPFPFPSLCPSLCLSCHQQLQRTTQDTRCDLLNPSPCLGPIHFPSLPPLPLPVPSRVRHTLTPHYASALHRPPVPPPHSAFIQAQSKRARESKKLQDGGNALQTLMMDLGSVMNLAAFEESE